MPLPKCVCNTSKSDCFPNKKNKVLPERMLSLITLYCHAGLLLSLKSPRAIQPVPAGSRRLSEPSCGTGTKWTPHPAGLLRALVLMDRNTPCFQIPECFSQLSNSSHQPGHSCVGREDGENAARLRKVSCLSSSVTGCSEQRSAANTEKLRPIFKLH